MAYPTGFHHVDALLQRLCTGAQRVLGEELVGFYIHGSIALGDFDPQRSDIDFLVVTQGELSEAALAGLAAMHAGIAASNYEGSYITQAAIRRWDGGPARFPVVRCDGSFGWDEHRSAWVIQRHVIREHGIALAGPPPAALIDPVSPDQLRTAVRQLLQEWWAPMLHDSHHLRDSEYQAYAVLTMCRMLYTLVTGEVATKPQAARWAREQLGDRWHGVIYAAAAWRHGVELDRLDQVLALLRWVIVEAATGFATSAGFSGGHSQH